MSTTKQEPKKEEPLKVEVVSPLLQETKTKEEKSVAAAQAEQMYGKAKLHAPEKPTRLDHEENGQPSSGAPVAQGPNISKEEAEFAANVAAAGGTVQPEKTPASTEVK